MMNKDNYNFVVTYNISGDVYSAVFENEDKAYMFAANKFMDDLTPWNGSYICYAAAVLIERGEFRKAYHLLETANASAIYITRQRSETKITVPNKDKIRDRAADWLNNSRS